MSIRAGAWIRAPTRGWRLFGGRVDTRPYAGLAVVGGRVDTRPYEALRFGTLAQPISILPQVTANSQFSILNSQFSRRTAARVWPPYADP